MHLILCHQTADFDALGAAVGLSKLHSNAKIVLTGGAHRGVQNFLALFRDEFALVERRTVHLKQITQLSVVDTQQRDRLGPAAAWFDLPHLKRIALYDHHCQSQTDIPTTEQQVEAVGATTTLMVEKLQAAEQTLTIAEATVMALGIHVDTGSLTYNQTTPRDGLALAWLLTQGADPATIRTYLEPGLTPELQTLLAQALDTFETHSQQGYQIATVFLVTDAFVPGLSNLTERLIDLLDYDALLLGHQYQRRSPTDQRLTVIGRSRIPQTDLHDLLAEWGGGHAQAAAATIKTTDGAAQFQAILQDWLAQIPPPLTARDLMSAPVRTIRPQTTITEAQRILLRYGHSGLSVVNAQDELVGVISRRDLDIALHHGFGHAPAKAYMSRDPHTIAPTTGLPDIEALMVTYDVGRLPVVEAGDLVGIVTRTDVLRQRQTVVATPRQQAVKPWARCPMPHPQTLMEPQTWQLLKRLAQAAQTRGWHLYLVGGVVRDLLLSQSRSPAQLQDIDLVVDGFHRSAQAEAGVELAKSVQQWYPEARLEIHGAFQTAALLWHKHPEFGSLALDIATARTEFYPYPAANPEVEASSIRQDLYRRDFAINAMALRLTAPREGEVLDFFGGMQDVRSRQIRVLHTNSFIEDPTRIYRAVRFAVRLGFELESHTEELIHYAIASGVYGRSLTNYPKAPALTTRLKAELKAVLTSAYWQPALELLSHLQAWQCLHPELHIAPQVYPKLRLLDRSLRRFDPDYTLNHWQLRLELILLQLPTEQAVQVGQNLQLAEGAIARLQQFQSVLEELSVQLTEDSQPSAIAAQLKPYDTALLSLLLVQLPRPQRQQIWQYLTHWSQLKAPLNGNDLKQLGYPRGPQYRVILDDLLNATLDGNIQTREDALIYLQAVHPLPQR